MAAALSRWSASCVVVTFVLFWSALTLGVDALLTWRAVRQVAALNYPSVAGTIRESKVTEEFDEAMMYGVAVTYDYNVHGWDYTGERYRYGAGHASDSHAK